MKSLLKISRPSQWIKSALVLLAPVMSAEIFSFKFDLHLRVTLTILSFILASISIYCLNDLVDSELDKLNPNKNQRPLATGEISKWKVSIYGFVAASVSISISIILGNRTFCVVLAYLISNVAYSFVIKNVPFWEMYFVAFGFLLRSYAGAILVAKSPSVTFYLVVFIGALLIVLSKRIAEFNHDTYIRRKVLAYYNRDFLVSISTICVALLSAAYTSFILSTYFVRDGMIREIFLYLTALPFLSVVFEIHRKAIAGEAEQPELVYARDKYILINCFLWLTLFFLAEYL
jgi:decaprenyl-phosphate phosphoribosyltransferase